MTARPPATLEPPLYVSDDELPRWVGLDKETLGVKIRLLDCNPKSGFPPKDPQCEDKRYWPNVRAWFDDPAAYCFGKTKSGAPKQKRHAVGNICLTARPIKTPGDTT